MSLKTENSRRVAKSRPVCMGLNVKTPSCTKIEVYHNLRHHNSYSHGFWLQRTPIFGTPRRSLKYTHAGSFIFDLYRKCLFLEFVARKRNISSRPGSSITQITLYPSIKS